MMATTRTETILQQRQVLLQRFPSFVAAVQPSKNADGKNAVPTICGCSILCVETLLLLLPQIRFISATSLTWCCPNRIIQPIIELMFSFVNVKVVTIAWEKPNICGRRAT
jgi:hypothetical protein